MRIRPKRWLFLLHRYFGIGMCLLFALWFASGIVMMYVEYPELTEQERLDDLPPIDARRISVTTEAALAASGIHGGLEQLRLSSVGGRPAWLLVGVDGQKAVVFADDGSLLGNAPLLDDGSQRGDASQAADGSVTDGDDPRLGDDKPADGSARLAGAVDAELALATVRSSGFMRDAAAPVYDAKTDMDQWTVSEVLDPHRPLHRVHVGDVAGTVVYVSDTTGQIVRDTTRRERLWNWVGSTIHWIYPYQLRRHRSVWVDLIVYISLAGIVSVVTGAVIGFMRLQWRKRRGRRSITPYRGMAKWHHVLGLVGLVFVSTFIFSGLMSMGPWGIFDSATSAAEQVERYTGGPIRDLAAFPRVDLHALPAGTREVEWHTIQSAGHLVLSRSAVDRRVLLHTGTDPLRTDRAVELARRIERALPSFLPEADITNATLLHDYDDYYYTRHNRYAPLPVYRVRFNDAEATWFHVDLTTGAVVSRLTSRTRLERWLFNGLHSLDFQWLIRRGGAWDVTVIALSVLGFVFSITSVVLGWRRLRRMAGA